MQGSRQGVPGDNGAVRGGGGRLGVAGWARPVLGPQTAVPSLSPCLRCLSLPNVLSLALPPPMPLLRAPLGPSPSISIWQSPQPLGEERDDKGPAAEAGRAPSLAPAPEGGRESFLTPEGTGSFRTTARPDSEAPASWGPGGEGGKDSPSHREWMGGPGRQGPRRH